MLYTILKLTGYVLINPSVNNMLEEDNVLKEDYFPRRIARGQTQAQLKNVPHLSQSARAEAIFADKVTVGGYSFKSDEASSDQISTPYYLRTGGNRQNRSLINGTQGDAIDKLEAFIHNTPILVNPHSFRYIREPGKVCDESNIYLVIYIHSAPKQFERREHIRQTWGNSTYHEVKFALFFVIGMVSNDAIFMQDIEEESEKYNDVLQEDFEDSYRNLSLKAIAALRWIDLHCKHVKFVLKADDDTFINMFNYLKQLKSIDTESKNNKNTIICAI